MRCVGDQALVQGEDSLFQRPVGFRYAFVLMQMLEPRFEKERLEESPGLSDVLDDLSSVRAVAAALA